MCETGKGNKVLQRVCRRSSIFSDPGPKSLADEKQNCCECKYGEDPKYGYPRYPGMFQEMAPFSGEAVCKCDKQRSDLACTLADVKKCCCSVIVEIVHRISKLLCEKLLGVENSCTVVTRLLVVPQGEEIQKTWVAHRGSSADMEDRF